MQARKRTSAVASADGVLQGLQVCNNCSEGPGCSAFISCRKINLLTLPPLSNTQHVNFSFFKVCYKLGLQ